MTRRSAYWLAASALLLAHAAGTGRARAQEPGFSVSEASGDTFVVYRARPKGDAVEGFVIDRNALVETLRTRVLEQQGLGNLARVSAAKPGRAGRYASSERDDVKLIGTDTAYAFTHRFAAPFAAIEAQLNLAPLEDEDEADLVLPLSLLLALAVVGGLFALYRMAAVQVRFAERRNNFVASVSHELKTPLTAIRMYGEMLSEGMVEDETKRSEYYGFIRAESERLSRLINNVLELSKLERDERAVQLVVGDIGHALRDVVALFRPHAQEAGFALGLTERDAPLLARFDRDALTQVVFNLLDNALKYGQGDGQRSIDIHYGRAGDGVFVAVRDGGRGVADTQLGANLEPFYRVENELTRTQKGTGIGLALVRGLVQRMDGRVEARNLSPGFEVRIQLLPA